MISEIGLRIVSLLESLVEGIELLLVEGGSLSFLKSHHGLLIVVLCVGCLIID